MPKEGPNKEKVATTRKEGQGATVSAITWELEQTNIKYSVRVRSKTPTGKGKEWRKDGTSLVAQ